MAFEHITLKAFEVRMKIKNWKKKKLYVLVNNKILCKLTKFETKYFLFLLFIRFEY